MEEMEIIKQLYDGTHLEDKDLKRAKHIVYGLDLALKDRLKSRGLKWESLKADGKITWKFNNQAREICLVMTWIYKKIMKQYTNILKKIRRKRILKNETKQRTKRTFNWNFGE